MKKLQALFWSMGVILALANDLRAEMNDIEEWVNKADLIIVGEVVRLGKPPSFWSGLVPAFQNVEYEVKDVLKGEYSAKIIKVKHTIARGGMYVNHESPNLSNNFFEVGSQKVLFLGREPSAFIVIDSGDAILEADHKTIKTVSSQLDLTK